MSRDLGRDVPDLEKLYARKLWADFSYPSLNQRKTKGQQLQGKIVSALFLHTFHTSPHLFTLFQNYPELFLQDFSEN